jgi:hypothetical protein
MQDHRQLARQVQPAARLAPTQSHSLVVLAAPASPTHQLAGLVEVAPLVRVAVVAQVPLPVLVRAARQAPL